MDIQKETCCRHLPLYPATSIPVPGVTPSGLIFRTSDKESADHGPKPDSSVPRRRKGRPPLSGELCELSGVTQLVVLGAVLECPSVVRCFGYWVLTLPAT